MHAVISVIVICACLHVNGSTQKPDMATAGFADPPGGGAGGGGGLGGGMFAAPSPQQATRVAKGI